MNPTITTPAVTSSGTICAQQIQIGPNPYTNVVRYSLYAAITVLSIFTFGYIYNKGAIAAGANV